MENNNKSNPLQLAYEYRKAYEDSPLGRRIQALQEELKADKDFQRLYQEGKEVANKAATESESLKILKQIKEKISSDIRVIELEKLLKESSDCLNPLTDAYNKRPGKEYENLIWEE